MDEFFLMAKLDSARIAVDAARRKLTGIDPESPEFERAQMAYLQALVHHLSIVAIMQAHQHERLSAQVASLREELAHPVLH